MKTETSDILGVIPARFNSTRLLGKPLKIIGDKPMIQHVYERTKKTLPNGKVFLVKDRYEYALYFSRNIIPFIRYNNKENITDNTSFFQHIGIYGYTKKALEKFCNQKPSSLEMSEKLEQLRWLENGGKIKVGITKQLSYPVDTIEDLNEVRKIYEKKHHI